VYGWRVLEAVRKRLERARLLVRAVRSTGVIRPVRRGGFVEFLRGARKLPPGLHFAVMFHAAARPDQEALVEYGLAGVRRLSWGELDAAINRLANALIARGAGTGSRVALMLPNGADHLIAQHALGRLGATAVQIGYHLKAAEIAHILGNAEPAATLLHADVLDTMRAARAQAALGGPMIVLGDLDGDARRDPAITEWDRALAAASPEVARRARSDDAGIIIYTSGTTGKSKGAHRSYKTSGLDAVTDMLIQVGMRADDRHLVVCPLYHSAAPAFAAITLLLGGTIIVMDHFEPARALEIIERERVTGTMMVPTMLTRLTNLPEEVLAARDTRSLRWVMSGAAPLTTENARRFMARFGPILWNFYGATETGLVTIAGPEDHLSHPGTIGRALRGNEIRLLDESGRDVPDGEVGELYVRNEMLISGYHRNAEATRSSLRDGLFSVGDLGRRDPDGYYFLEARKHDMVISGGVNIYPREIEDHLHGHPAILDAAVVGVPDPEWGESLRAFVVLRDGHQLSEADVVAFCRAGLADFKRPRRVTFVAELPRNPTGKVLKRELRALS
jgi:fatty-acyl-CoA synthase